MVAIQSRVKLPHPLQLLLGGRRQISIIARGPPVRELTTVIGTGLVIKKPELYNPFRKDFLQSQYKLKKERKRKESERKEEQKKERRKKDRKEERVRKERNSNLAKLKVFELSVA